jgi:hypothetical protein
MDSENVKLTIDDFGSVEDHISKEMKQVKRFTWKNLKSNVSVQVFAMIDEPKYSN